MYPLMPPREHGAWVVLAAPIFLGLLIAPVFSAGAAALFVLGALAFFLLRVPAQILWERPDDRGALRWLSLYAAVTLGSFLPLIVLLGRWKLLLLAVPAGLLLAANLHANRSGRRFSALNEASGILGLCLGAPAACYAASAELAPRGWALWLLCSGFFLGPIFHVKMAALQHRGAADPAALPGFERMRRLSTAYHAMALLAVVAWAADGGVAWPAMVPFAAAFFKTVKRGLSAPERVDFRSLGRLEVAYSVLFVIFAAVSMGRGL
ncbi:MAG: YwiC-like family protein [Elusimicrobia bacterium]|nr:YwiC-like family protein [Elusimicrobiota bacterium]